MLVTILVTKIIHSQLVDDVEVCREHEFVFDGKKKKDTGIIVLLIT